MGKLKKAAHVPAHLGVIEDADHCSLLSADDFKLPLSYLVKQKQQTHPSRDYNKSKQAEKVRKGKGKSVDPH